jgi:hypothetical protein
MVSLVSLETVLAKKATKNMVTIACFYGIKKYASNAFGS